MKSTFKILLAGILFTGLLLGCNQPATDEKVTLPFYNTPDFTPEWIKEEEAGYQNIHQIANFEFVNQLGQQVNNNTFEGKIYVADFFFTICPSICPKMTNNLLQIQKAFDKDDDIMILSHSVTPKIDSVGQLFSYANTNKIDSDKWHLVTGDQREIYDMARKSYFAEKAEGYDKPVDAFVHTENFILVDHRKRIRGIYNGTLAVELKRLIADIQTLKTELKH